MPVVLHLRRASCWVTFIFFTSISFGAWGDRITLYQGDIFIGAPLESKESRIWFDRQGFRKRIPTWWIKKWEAGVNQLALTSNPVGKDTVDSLQVFGEILSVSSTPPVEISHLEFYPRRSHFWIEGDRYLRGYLVNRTSSAYHSLKADIVFYGSDRVVSATQTLTIPLLREKAEVFDVYPMTMKPFLVDARFVPWEKVKAILIQPAGAIPMHR